MAACALLMATHSLADDEFGWRFLTAEDWQAITDKANATAIVSSPPVTGSMDLIGSGALVLEKQDPTKPFWKTTAFRSEGSWRSQWLTAPDGKSPASIRLTLLAYGRLQDWRSGWKRFAGNPLICAMEERNATPQSLRLPPGGVDNGPNDPALERGIGPYAGKWLALYCIGPWANHGIGFAVADSLEPIKQGKNPFTLTENSNPLIAPDDRHDEFAKANSPNDWLPVNGKWYIPVEGLRHDMRNEFINTLWTADAKLKITRQGEIEGINGHDPGICTDGERFYLFNEDGNWITCCSAANPLGPWKDEGRVLDVGRHTGDADLLFFNNRWHMVFDDGPHRRYLIGHGWTTPEEFPRGWRLESQFFGPKQAWEQPTEDGNRFGTGDGDLALDDDTLYMVYERPLGIAWKDLDVYAADPIQAKLTIELDHNGDGKTDASQALDLRPGKNLTCSFKPAACHQYRLVMELSTRDATVSPLVKNVLKISPGTACLSPASAEPPPFAHCQPGN
jgi:hypothetical protein